MTRPEIFFGFTPVILTAQEAESGAYLEDQSLYVDDMRRGYDSGYVGGLQAVVASKPGRPGQALIGEEVDRVTLHRLLREGFDLLILAGSVDAECGAITVDEGVMVIADEQRCKAAQDMLADGYRKIVLWERVHSLARAVDTFN